MGFQTDCVLTGEDRGGFNGATSPPIYQTSVFTSPSFEEFEDRFPIAAEGEGERYVYTRGNNPTVQTLERKVAALEGAEEARAFASGMAAIASALLSETGSGDHVVATRSIYGNAYRLLHGYLPKLGIETTFVDATNTRSIADALRPNTRVLYLESPGNPAMHLVDIPAAAELARQNDLVTIFDNTIGAAYNQKPLLLGMDLVVHSASKYLGGHGDLVAGMIAGSATRMRSLSGNELRDLGGILGPFDAWLILRGIRTLGLRMKAHNEGGLRAAQWLESRPEIETVFYAGLPSHPQYDLAKRQMCGFGGLLSVVVKGGREAAATFVNRLRLFGIGVSWGEFKSLALPMGPETILSVAAAEELGIVPGFVRLFIGLEDVEDLIADLEQALQGVPNA